MKRLKRSETGKKASVSGAGKRFGNASGNTVGSTAGKTNRKKKRSSKDSGTAASSLKRILGFLEKWNPFLNDGKGMALAAVLAAIGFMLVFIPNVIGGAILPVMAVLGLVLAVFRFSIGSTRPVAHPIFNIVLAILLVILCVYALMRPGVEPAFAANIGTALGACLALDRVNVVKALRAAGYKREATPSLIICGLYWVGAVYLAFLAATGTLPMIIKFQGMYLVASATFILLSVKFFCDYSYHHQGEYMK